MPSQWYDELIHTFFIKLVIDLTPMDGKFAYQAVRQRIGYMGITFNEAHSNHLHAKLKAQVMDEMKDPSSKLYVPAYAKAVNGDAPPATPLPPAPAPKRRSRAKPKAKAEAAPAADAGEAHDPPPAGEEESPVIEVADEEGDVWDPTAA